ncbi:MAG: hypothetical protein J1F64_07510, partial [Oscillospiraceae bacterium]|nr:hypothetical protein [Oscillospiraceae bacterium]
LANDIGAVVLAVNNAVEKVRTLCGKGDLDLDNLLDYAEDMEKTIKNNAGNGKKVYNIIFDFCAELYSRFENDIDKINGTKISTNDVVAIYNREYDFDNTKDEPSSSQKTALDNAVKKPDQITKSDLDKIIGYSDSNVKTDKDLVVVYQDAVSELVKNIGYDTSSKSDASRLADDVACVVEVANESIDKVLELAKAGNLNADTLLGFKSEIDSIIDSTASSANKAEVKNAVNDFAIALYGKLDGKLSEINGNADLTVEKLLEFYNANK